MLIQDDNNFISVDSIKDLFPEQLLYDCNDISLVNKFIIVVRLKDESIQYLDKIFDTGIEASEWINEIAHLQLFELMLKNYKF